MADVTLQTVSQYNGGNGGNDTSAVTMLLARNYNTVKSCLPREFDPARMCRIAVQTIQANPALAKCEPASLVACVIEAASLGLEIDGRGLAYLVPMGRKVKLIIGYKGLMELAYRSGKVSSISAEVVGENEEFIYELGLRPQLIHRPCLEGRGRFIGTYAVARMKDRDIEPVFVVMGRDEVEKIRDASQASRRSDSPWMQWESEMWKKSAIRKLCKYLPLSPEVSRAVALDEQADAGVLQQFLVGSQVEKGRSAEEPLPQRRTRTPVRPEPPIAQGPETPERSETPQLLDEKPVSR